MDGQCPECGVVEPHEPSCSLARSLKARLLFIRGDRERKLAALQERYMPQLERIYGEYRDAREEIWVEYERRAADLKAT